MTNPTEPVDYPGDPAATIVLHPGRCSGRPTINNTRLPVDLVYTTYWHHGIHEVQAMWEELRPADIIVSAWYLARYGTRTWRSRLKTWLDGNEAQLWGPVTYGQPAMPPRKSDNTPYATGVLMPVTATVASENVSPPTYTATGGHGSTHHG